MTIREKAQAFFTITRRPCRAMFRSGLAAIIICWMICVTAAAEPATKPPGQTSAQHGLPVYRIYALRNGTCKIAGNHAFYRGDNTETYGFALYIWLILGGDKPMLVDAGLSDVAEMNRGAAHDPLTLERWPGGVIGTSTSGTVVGEADVN